MAKISNKTVPVVDEAVKKESVKVVEQAEMKLESVEEPVQEIVDDVPEIECGKKSDDTPENIQALMKLYPNYEEFYVTPKGFVHPAGVPEYLRKGATLYKNKFFNK